MAEAHLEQTSAETFLAAGRTHAPAAPTYSAISQISSHCHEGRENLASSSKAKTVGRLKLLLRKLINCCINLRGKRSFFGQICIKIAGLTPDLSNILESVLVLNLSRPTRVNHDVHNQLFVNWFGNLHLLESDYGIAGDRQRKAEAEVV